MMMSQRCNVSMPPLSPLRHICRHGPIWRPGSTLGQRRSGTQPCSQRRVLGHSPRKLTRCTATSEDRSTYRLIQLTLRKPLGLVLEDNPRNKSVFVAEVTPGGNADQSGQIKVGDILTKCSATVLKDGKEGEYEKEGYGKRLYTNWKKVMFATEGEDFDTVMKAIASNTERWGIFDIDLEFKRYTSEQQAS